VADFAPIQTTDAASLTDAERREVVVQDEALRGLAAGVAVEVLSFVSRCERRKGERLGFATLKERGSVRAWEQADFGGKLTEFADTRPSERCLRSRIAMRKAFFCR
jgi:aryl carrier-like protein